MGCMGPNTEEILTNQGKNFTSKILKGLCNMLKIKQLRTSIYHPQINGLVERFNRTLKEMSCGYIQWDPRRWDVMLFSIQEAPQASTGYAPFELVYGHSPWGLLDVICEGWESGPEATNFPQAVAHFRE